jgi:glycosyltransferase involved in cell wall biosynthesis
LCWDYNREKINLNGVTVKYVSRHGSLVSRNIRLLKAFHHEVSKKYNVIFSPYFRGISIIKLIHFKQNFIFDIRTLSVSTRLINRVIYNFILNLESIPFKYITTVSKGIANQLYFKKAEVLPLGAEQIQLKQEGIENVNLLYVGTLQGRNLIEAIKGFKNYLETYGYSNIHFTIVGDSPNGELEEIRRFVEDKNLLDYVTLTGRVKHSELYRYFNQASIGISYIPITKWYHYQPPTKTYEYLLAGLPVIATKTVENIKVVTADCGILIDDNAEAFCHGLFEILHQLDTYNLVEIRKKFSSYTWDKITRNNFIPLIQKISS